MNRQLRERARPTRTEGGRLEEGQTREQKSTSRGEMKEAFGSSEADMKNKLKGATLVTRYVCSIVATFPQRHCAREVDIERPGATFESQTDHQLV